ATTTRISSWAQSRTICEVNSTVPALPTPVTTAEAPDCDAGVHSRTATGRPHARSARDVRGAIKDVRVSVRVSPDTESPTLSRARARSVEDASITLASAHHHGPAAQIANRARAATASAMATPA